ncbi:MAG: thiamine phosphate synthase [Sutterella sp.]|nr:thiamine phosphate synthase [Sutterella sp.]
MRTSPDLTLYLVLDPVLCGGSDGMVQTARQAAQAGVTCVQLRAPNWSTKALVDCGLKLKRVLSPYGVPLIVNNDVKAAEIIGASGVHVGQSDMNPRKARALLGKDAVIGLSITRYEEIGTLDPTVVDYAGVGPVYATSTKKDAAPAMGPDVLRRIIENLSVPVVAIGGIGVAQAPEMRCAGARGIAVVSAICGQRDIALATRTLKSAFGQVS